MRLSLAERAAEGEHQQQSKYFEVVWPKWRARATDMEAAAADGRVMMGQNGSPRSPGQLGTHLGMGKGGNAWPWVCPGMSSRLDQSNIPGGLNENGLCRTSWKGDEGSGTTQS